MNDNYGDITESASYGKQDTGLVSINSISSTGLSAGSQLEFRKTHDVYDAIKSTP
jgi:hypothetical protein